MLVLSRCRGKTAAALWCDHRVDMARSSRGFYLPHFIRKFCPVTYQLRRVCNLRAADFSPILAATVPLCRAGTAAAAIFQHGTATADGLARSLKNSEIAGIAGQKIGRESRGGPVPSPCGGRKADVQLWRLPCHFLGEMGRWHGVRAIMALPRHFNCVKTVNQILNAAARG